MEEKRRFGRIPFGITIVLECGPDSHEAALEDISLNGARIKLVSDEAPGLSDGLVFVLPLAPGGPVLRFPAEVVHCDGCRAGLRFTGADPESFSHLLRLLQLNTGGEEQLEKELRELSEVFGKSPRDT